MKKINRLTLSLATLIVASGLALAAPVSARGGADTATTPSNDATFADDTVPNKTADSIKSHELADQLKEQAQAKLQTEKQNVKQHTEAEREKACTARKKNLSNRMSNAVRWANNHKSVIDTAYTRVKAFHDSKNLNVPDYSSLTSAVDTAQANAQTSIDALSALDVGVDCTSQTVASSVSNFQQAVKNTRDSLKTYRSTLVKLIEALKGASTSQDSGGTTDSSNNITNQ